jgi:hypothetical protein
MAAATAQGAQAMDVAGVQTAQGVEEPVGNVNGPSRQRD